MQSGAATAAVAATALKTIATGRRKQQRYHDSISSILHPRYTDEHLAFVLFFLFLRIHSPVYLVLREYIRKGSTFNR